MKLVETGKPIFCEKPLAPTYPLALEMTEAVEKRGIVNMVNLRYRGLPVMQMARALVEDGMIGEVRHIDACYLQSWLVGTHWGDWRTEDRWLWRLSGAHGSRGALGDVGIHILDFASYVADQKPGLGALPHEGLRQGGRRPHRRLSGSTRTTASSCRSSSTAARSASSMPSRWATGYANAQKLARVRHAGRAGDLVREREDEPAASAPARTCTRRPGARWNARPCPNTYETFIDAVRRGENLEPSFRRATELQNVSRPRLRIGPLGRCRPHRGRAGLAQAQRA